MMMTLGRGAALAAGGGVAAALRGGDRGATGTGDIFWVESGGVQTAGLPRGAHPETPAGTHPANSAANASKRGRMVAL